MLPGEVDELERRLSRIDDALAFGASYGVEFPQGFAGAAVDPTAGYRLVLLYTGDVEAHRHRLAGFPSHLRPEVREARWTLPELAEFKARVEATMSIPGIRIYGATIDLLANRVVVAFGAADPTLGDELIERLDSTGWLVPDWDGPFEPVDRPLGQLIVKVVDQSGKPAPGLPCRYTSVEASNAAEGGGDTSEAGLCQFSQVPQGSYRIDILEADELVDRILASAPADVMGGETREVTVIVNIG